MLRNFSAKSAEADRVTARLAVMAIPSAEIPVWLTASSLITLGMELLILAVAMFVAADVMK